MMRERKRALGSFALLHPGSQAQEANAVSLTEVRHARGQKHSSNNSETSVPESASTIIRELPTGTLSLVAHGERAIEKYCDVAARANPKRGFLIVSKVLGRHLPVGPSVVREAMDDLGSLIASDLPGPIVVLGMAETATGLGQGVFAAYRRSNPKAPAIYLQTSRQRVQGAELLASFEEGHSHATTHFVQVQDTDLVTKIGAARSLIIVDDECSSGRTFVACAQAMQRAMPHLTHIETCCLTDWSGGKYLDDMPAPSARHALIYGEMVWEARSGTLTAALPTSSNRPGLVPQNGMRCRTGIMHPERARRPVFSSSPNERILVLGEGEHTYEALLLAEELEQAGAIVAVQSITRTPALLGNSIQSMSRFSDSYGSGAQCYLYNLLGHAPDRVVIVTESPGEQVAEMTAALADLGSDVPATLLVCSYGASS